MNALIAPLTPILINKTLGASSGSVSGIVAAADIANNTLSLTTLGRPVLVVLAGGNSGSDTNERFTGNFGSAQLKIFRDSTLLYVCSTWRSSGGGATGFNGNGLPVLFIFDPVAAGTYTYKASVDNNGGSSIAYENLHLFVYEMGT